MIYVVVGGYYLGYEELIWAVILEIWVLYVVEDKIYVVEAICEYECIHWERLGVLYDDQKCV